MHTPEFISPPEFTESDVVERAVSIYRRAIITEKHPDIFAAIEDSLIDVPDIKVRRVTGKRRRPIVQLLRNDDAVIRLDRSKETEEELEDRLLRSIPSLNNDMTIQFDNAKPMKARNGENFILAKPSSKGAGPLYGERMAAFNVIRPLLLNVDENRMARTPDMTVAHGGEVLTQSAIQRAVNVVSRLQPFYVDFSPAQIDIRPTKNR